ncbi:MAG TPA: hypothetical protein VMZ22_12385 [Acidimicrobiales bacterium]|nr:hypothetical protein [Acidimicrobiales bacterium]
MRAYAATVSDADLGRAIQAHVGSVAGGLGVLFDELAAHDFFLNRDLDVIEANRQ